MVKGSEAMGAQGAAARADARRGTAAACTPSGGADAFRRSLQSVRWANVVGFGLCQTWNILCVALRDPVTYGEPFLDLRWVSIATALAVSLALAVAHGRCSERLRDRRLFAAVGVLAAASSMLGPASAAFPSVSALLIYLAAIGVGVGFSVLFITWYQRFCDERDMVGLACSVAASVLFTYPLANVLASDQVSPWFSAAVGSALPLVSVALGWRGRTGVRKAPAEPSEGSPTPFASLSSGKRLLCIRFSVCLLVVVAAIEAVRNLLLGGTAITFYAGVANLGGVTLKLACAVWLVAVFGMRDARGVSLSYRLAFLLLLGVVLCTPFLLQGNWFAHMLLDVSSFFFQLAMLMVAYQICVGFNLSSVAVFGCGRAIWAAGALAGIAVERFLRGGVPVEAVQLLPVVLGLAVAVSFAFVFTDRDCVRVLASVPVEAYAPRFKTQCVRLAERNGVSERELEVMVLTAKGRSATRIAEDLGVTTATVNTHIHHVYQKLGVHSRQQLMDLIEQEAAGSREVR